MNKIYTLIIAFLTTSIGFGQSQSKEVKLAIETDFWVVGETYSKKDTTEIEWGFSNKTLVLKNTFDLLAELKLPQLKTGHDMIVLNLGEYNLTFFSLAPKAFVYLSVPLQEIINRMGTNPFQEVELVGKPLNLSETIAGKECEWYAISPIDRNQPLKACFAESLPMDWNYVMNRIGDKDMQEPDRTKLPTGAILAIRDPKSDDLIYKAIKIEAGKSINIKQKISIR